MSSKTRILEIHLKNVLVSDRIFRQLSIVELKLVLNYSLENVFNQHNVLKLLYQQAVCASSLI